MAVDLTLFTEKSDIWALGCVLYELCSEGRHPFDASSQAALVIKILRGHYDPVSNRFSGALRGMVDTCLRLEPEERPSALEILEMDVVQTKVGIKPFLSLFILSEFFCTVRSALPPTSTGC